MTGAGASYGEVVEALRRSTVGVVRGGPGGGVGSGLIWGRDGEIVTNAHVASERRPHVELWDGRVLRAEVTRWDPERDLAALRVPARDLPAAAFADSGALRVGELAIAIGNPLGFRGALTTGVVHALGPCPGVGPRMWVQSDVQLAPGNSGGPLADARGRVIGLNTMIAGGLALAVPSNTVRTFLRRATERPRLGLAVRGVGLRDRGRTRPGLLVLDIEEGSAAAAASLLPGDILVSADGRPLRAPDDLLEAIDGAGDRVRLGFLRGDIERRREVTVALPVRNRIPEAA